MMSFEIVLQDYALNHAMRTFFQIYPKPARKAAKLLLCVASIPTNSSQHQALLCDVSSKFRVFDCFKHFSLSDIYALSRAREQIMLRVLKMYIAAGKRDTAHDYAAEIVVGGALLQNSQPAMARIQALSVSTSSEYPPSIQPLDFYKAFAPADLGHLLLFNVEAYADELLTIYDTLNALNTRPYLKAV